MVRRAPEQAKRQLCPAESNYGRTVLLRRAKQMQEIGHPGRQDEPENIKAEPGFHRTPP